jgi:hypothetical protein
MIESIISPLTCGLKGNENIAFIAPGYSPMYDAVLSYLKLVVPRGKVFFIESKSAKLDLKLDARAIINYLSDPFSLAKYLYHSTTLSTHTNTHAR